MSTVLITGGLGFIGSHTSVNLLERGFNILIIDSLVNSSIENLKNIDKTISKSNINKKYKGTYEFRKGDIKDTEWLNNIFHEYTFINKKITSVIHLAGLKSVKESVINPLKYWKENIDISISLLSVMKQHECKTIVFSSTAMVYEPDLNKKLDEKSFISPPNPYGNSKLAIENILRDIYKIEPLDWRIVNLRYFNPVGAHELGFIGDNPLVKENNLFPAIAKTLKKEKEKIYIFGKDWPTIDGTCIRDYIHIMDLADAHFEVLNFLKNNKPQIIDLNIGTGKGTTVLEVIKLFENTNNVTLPYEFVGRREGDIPYLVADNTKSTKTLKWRPQKSLANMCKDFWNYISKN